jgi:prephenate dehydratase
MHEMRIGRLFSLRLSKVSAGRRIRAMKIGVMGAKGSFSEEAGRAYAHKAGLKKYSLEYLVTAEKVLAALEAGGIDLGIFPIENSNGGVVLEAVHAMAKHRFHIKKMFEIDVHHCLLVKKGTTADKVRTITSHDQAIKQCRMYLKRRWPKVKIKEYEDTAKAAEDLAAGILPASTAVIAARAAANVYKLDVLEESVQDLKFNYTSFIAAERLK